MKSRLFENIINFRNPYLVRGTLEKNSSCQQLMEVPSLLHMMTFLTKTEWNFSAGKYDMTVTPILAIFIKIVENDACPLTKIVPVS